MSKCTDEALEWDALSARIEANSLDGRSPLTRWADGRIERTMTVARDAALVETTSFPGTFASETIVSSSGCRRTTDGNPLGPTPL